MCSEYKFHRTSAPRHLSLEEEMELADRIQEGDEDALALMVESNIGLVITIARSMCRIPSEMADFVSAGVVGLTIAATRFEKGRNAKFSTYASWWIRQRISQERRRSSVIRLPAVADRCRLEVVRLTKAYVDKLGREPTSQELKEQLPDQYAYGLIKAVKSVLGLCSLDDASEHGGDGLGNRIASSGMSPLDELAVKDDQKHLLEKLDCLTERERFVVISRYGLNERRKVMTLEELSDILGITRERVRQIQVKAIRRLRCEMND